MTNTVELHLRAALDAAPSGILMTDARGRIVLANRQIEALFGYAREDLLGKEAELLVAERFRADHVELRVSVLGDPQSRNKTCELSGLRKDGSELPLEIVLTPVATDEGCFVSSAIVDISARKRAEERFGIAIESSPSGMLMVDSSGRIVLVNSEIERMFGYERAELLGQSIELLVPERFRADHPRQREGFFVQPRARPMGMGRELYGVRKNGVEFPLEIGLNPIPAEQGFFVLSSVVDISARQSAQQDHRRLEDQLRQAQKSEAIGRLASGIAHDFNNLLMGILGCGELARHVLSSNHAARPIIEDICGAAGRGATLTKDLLNFSRRKPVQAVPLKLNSVVRIAARMLRQIIGEDLRLEVDLCTSGGLVLGSPTYLEHILLNLAVNARDAMPAGGRLRISTRDVELGMPLTTRTRSLGPGSYVVLEVQDSGTGMDEAALEHMFEPFFTTKEIGTGLGLYIVHSIVNQMGGALDVESKAGRGTRFSIFLPRLVAVPGDATPPTPAAPRHSRRTPAHILVVEDERLIRSTLRQLLVRMGYRVTVAEDATGAMAAARDFPGPIDLLLSDIVLPDASGTDVAKTLMSERQDLKVLFMSAYPTDLLVQQGRIALGTRTLEKPFDERSLANAVDAALQLSTASEA